MNKILKKYITESIRKGKYQVNSIVLESNGKYTIGSGISGTITASAEEISKGILGVDSGGKLSIEFK